MIRVALVAITLASIQLSAQLRQIEFSKLPSDKRVQTAYSDALSVEQYSRAWTNNWKYDVPKEKVVSTLRASLHSLTAAQADAPQNEELLVLTGLVARLAYNVDIDEAYEIAFKSFDSAHRILPSDYRPGWLAGIHRCQSNAIKAGMEQLLEVEDKTPWQQLPVDFWDDYINCAMVAAMPAHTMRAISRAVKLGEDKSSFSFALETAQKRYKATDLAATYPARQAWEADTRKDEVRFVSQVCGTAFSSRPDWHLGLNDVTKGTCTTTIETGPYPRSGGESTPTILLLTKAAQQGETLEEFVKSSLKTRFALAKAMKPFSCPAADCVGFEIVDKNVYQSEGGGHLLVAAFANVTPEFPGVLFEQPDEPPKAGTTGTTYYHPVERWSRLPGVLFSVVLLDSNGEIFDRAANDYEYVLKSIQLD